jgi:hypothetical protein
MVPLECAKLTALMEESVTNYWLILIIRVDHDSSFSRVVPHQSCWLISSAS